MKHYDIHGDNVINLKIENAKLLNLSESEYRPLAALNQSYIKDCYNVSPSYAEYRLKNPEIGPALIFGSALHHYVLEQSTFYGHYAVAPQCDRRTSAGKATWEAFVADSGDKTVLKEEDFHKIHAMAKALGTLFQSTAVGAKYVVEQCIVADAVVTEGEFKGAPLRLKAKFDWLSLSDEKLVTKDLKSIADITSVVGASYNNGWAIQSAFYSDLMTAYKPVPNDFYYIPVSKEEPHDARVFKVSDEMLIAGRKRYLSAIHKMLWWEANGRPDTAQFHGIDYLNG
jgi:hypothetical protein